jgi:hypothetical protein
VDRVLYDQSVDVLRTAVEKSRVGDKEKVEAIKRLKSFAKRIEQSA